MSVMDEQDARAEWKKTKGNYPALNAALHKLAKFERNRLDLEDDFDGENIMRVPLDDVFFNSVLPDIKRAYKGVLVPAMFMAVDATKERVAPDPDKAHFVASIAFDCTRAVCDKIIAASPGYLVEAVTYRKAIGAYDLRTAVGYAAEEVVREGRYKGVKAPALSAAIYTAVQCVGYVLTGQVAIVSGVIEDVTPYATGDTAIDDLITTGPYYSNPRRLQVIKGKIATIKPRIRGDKHRSYTYNNRALLNGAPSIFNGIFDDFARYTRGRQAQRTGIIHISLPKFHERSPALDRAVKKIIVGYDEDMYGVPKSDIDESE